MFKNKMPLTQIFGLVEIVFGFFFLVLLLAADEGVEAFPKAIMIMLGVTFMVFGTAIILRKLWAVWVTQIALILLTVLLLVLMVVFLSTLAGTFWTNLTDILIIGIMAAVFGGIMILGVVFLGNESFLKEMEEGEVYYGGSSSEILDHWEE